MHKETLARRLREAREARGMTQEQAANAVGLARSAVARVESGERSVSTLELARFAEAYRRPVGDFFSGQALDEDVSVVLYRAFPVLGEEKVRDVVDRVLDICRTGMGLEQLLDWNEASAAPPQHGLEPSHNAYRGIQQGLAVASHERRRLGLAEQPIADIAELISAQGVWATGATLPNDVSGLFLHHRSVGMAILVNGGHPPVRKRFSYAHEYGHVLMDRAERMKVSSSENANDLIEKRANAFAAEFLMPEGGVRSLLLRWHKGGKSREEHAFYDVATDSMKSEESRSPSPARAITYHDVAMVANHFGVSYLAAAYRLKSIFRMSEERSQELIDKEFLGKEFLEILGRGGEVGEVANRARLGRELVGRVAHLAIEAYRREEISRGRLLDIAKQLGVPSARLLKLVDGT